MTVGEGKKEDAETNNEGSIPVLVLMRVLYLLRLGGRPGQLARKAARSIRRPQRERISPSSKGYMISSFLFAGPRCPIKSLSEWSSVSLLHLSNLGFLLLLNRLTSYSIAITLTEISMNPLILHLLTSSPRCLVNSLTHWRHLRSK